MWITVSLWFEGLGKGNYSRRKSQKDLKIMTEKWEAKVFMICKAKDLSTLKYEDLIGVLLTHEMMTSKPKGT